jgi:protein-L-isoaspartate(D-aspartate) O-methyltransferase
MSDLSDMRRLYAERIRNKAGLRCQRLIEALAQVPREDFLGEPPWGTMKPPTVWLTDLTSEISEIYDDVIVALDASRHLNNGLPSAVTAYIDALELHEGDRVLHAGAGTGYYTALIAHCVGNHGQVTGVELDSELAERARSSLKGVPQVKVVCGDATTYDAGEVDAILVNAGATYPCPIWLNSLAPGGRLMLPLVRWPKGSQFGSGIAGFGAMFQIDRLGSGFAAKFLAYFAVFPCLGALDEDSARLLAAAFDSGRVREMRSLRRNPHPENPSCILHGRGYCFSTASPD